ncbi:MAG: FecR domain-containing protein [Pseudomonadota bacterium]
MKNALEEAIAWYARLQAPDCRPEERTQFAYWLAQHSSHADAYASVERFTGELDNCGRQDLRWQALTAQALAMGTADVMPASRQPRRWRHLTSLAAAASLVAGILLVLLQPDFLQQQPALLAYDSPLNEQRSLTLSDGSQTSLDIDSAVTVQMSANARDINLVKGRALFEVAHDTQRPFTVTAGTGRITALGTRFQVQRDNKVVIVTLTEGSVEVVNDVAGDTLRTRLRPGEQLRYAEDSGLWELTTVETDAVTSWSRGRHVFRNLRLADALDEVNRYAATKVRLADPALADLTVSGNFMIGDSNRISAAFAAALPVTVAQDRGELLLVPAVEPDRVQ